ncbi:hypothetical protein [Salinisphaera aquimarina]|uniref:Uncharacterized protein n=1 Tax=Salinisphaera aquimarina TaxID=2094031 RepID=A0ABV7ERB9_9GAMM
MSKSLFLFLASRAQGLGATAYDWIGVFPIFPLGETAILSIAPTSVEPFKARALTMQGTGDGPPTGVERFSSATYVAICF